MNEGGRLSGLQKWILRAALADNEHIIPARKSIAAGFWGERSEYRPARVVSVCRTLRGLQDKGLIQRRGTGFSLTIRGTKEAAAYSMGINNKGLKARRAGINNKSKPQLSYALILKFNKRIKQGEAPAKLAAEIAALGFEVPEGIK